MTDDERRTTIYGQRTTDDEHCMTKEEHCLKINHLF